ncbi:MAG: C40 family peptidase [Flavobacteriales bacterium]|nr:C40 family peptidase [Flavobacteriales bacterium]
MSDLIFLAKPYLWFGMKTFYSNTHIITILLLVVLISCKGTKKASTNNVELDKTTVELQNKYADILKVDAKAVQNIKLYQFVDEWVGVQYKYGGTSKSGVDCSGFCNVLYNNVYSKTLPRTSSEIAKQLQKVPKGSLAEGDILVFDIEGKRNSHVGVYLANSKFVHASTSSGVIISSLEHPYYQKAYSKGGKL